MHIKFHRGGGMPAAAARYLTAERDALGQRREGVEVLRGDPDQVAAVAASLGFKHQYSAGVIAWSAQDAPSDAQINEVVDEFKTTAWVGLTPERYA